MYTRKKKNPNKKTRVFKKKELNSGDGMLTTVWGPSMWHVLHTMSFNYPVQPTKEDKQNYFTWNDETINNFNLKNVPLWISGHTHWSYNIEKKDCCFISNQLGYKYEANITKFNQDGLYEITY